MVDRVREVNVEGVDYPASLRVDLREMYVDVEVVKHS